tara:strand:+ start:468 stop:662 length:195 start_codon:yes stop_codon:yes gene_type:complete
MAAIVASLEPLLEAALMTIRQRLGTLGATDASGMEQGRLVIWGMIVLVGDIEVPVEMKIGFTLG